MTGTLDSQVTVRGTRDGVLIVLGDGDWNSVLRDLEQQLARPNASAFFRGARVSIETGNRFFARKRTRGLGTRPRHAQHSSRRDDADHCANACPARRTQ